MVKAIGITGKFYFNLDGNVGVASQNNRDDAQLVQLGYFCMARNPQVRSKHPDMVELALKVQPGAIYHGDRDDPLTLAIRKHEQLKGGTQDGRVSKIQSEATATYSQGNRHIILILCELIAEHNPDIYPRIERHPQCPPLLAEQVKLISNLSKGIFVP